MIHDTSCHVSITYVTGMHGFHLQTRAAAELVNGHRVARVEAMRKFVVALLPLLACLPLGAQDAEAQKKFAGTWAVSYTHLTLPTNREV